MNPTATHSKIIEEACRRFVSANPTASIDDIARALSDQFSYRDGGGLSKTIISRIRLEEHLKLGLVKPGEAAMDEDTHAPTQPPNSDGKEPFNPPHFQQFDNHPDPTSGPRHRPSTHSERRSWLDDWVLAHPKTTVKDARQALFKKFGMGIGTAELASVLRDVREMIKDDQARQRQTVLMHMARHDDFPFLEFIARCRERGIKKIEISPDGVIVKYSED